MLPLGCTVSSHHLTCSPESEDAVALYFKFPTFINKRQIQYHIKKHGFGCNIVSIDMHTNKHTRKPAGTAKVVMVPSTQKDKFISDLNGTCLPGKFQQLLSVQPYIQMRRQCKERVNPCKVFVGSGFPYFINEEHIKKHFVKFKHLITNVEIKREKRGKVRYVFVTFKTNYAAKEAIGRYHTSYFHGKQIKVEMYKPDSLLPDSTSYLSTVHTPITDSQSTTCSEAKAKSDRHYIVEPHHVERTSSLVSQNPSTMIITTNEMSIPKCAYEGAQPSKSKIQSTGRDTDKKHHLTRPLVARGMLSAAVSCTKEGCTAEEESFPKCTDDKEYDEDQLLNIVTTVIVENLDPNITQSELESLTCMKIDSYTPSNLTPDKVAAWVEVANCTRAGSIADNLNGRTISGKKIHCYLVDSNTLQGQVYGSTIDKPLERHFSSLDLDASYPVTYGSRPLFVVPDESVHMHASQELKQNAATTATLTSQSLSSILSSV